LRGQLSDRVPEGHQVIEVEVQEFVGRNIHALHMLGLVPSGVFTKEQPTSSSEI
jgi:hypothetical protein